MDKIKRKIISIIIIILGLLVATPTVSADNSKPSYPARTRCQQCHFQRLRLKIRSSLRRQKIRRLRRQQKHRFMRRCAYREVQRERQMRRHCYLYPTTIRP